MTNKLATVAWQGVAIQVPEDWSLVGVSGDEKKGYFRVDSPVASAIEVRWSHAAGKAPDLMVKGREFLSSLEKLSRKSKSKFDKSIKQDKDSEHSVSFSWRADKLGQGKLIYCSQCDRVIIAQIISARDENISHLVPVILNSITDHRDDGWTAWALYGMSFAVPQGYKISKQSLMSGYISLQFKKHAQLLTIERWGLASTLLSENAIKEWYKKDAVPDIKGYKIGIIDEEVREHEGLKIEGRRAGIKQALKALVHAATLHPHPKYLTGYVWHCEESNRLFSIRSTHSAGDDTAEKIRDMIECHERSARRDNE